jgi:NAD(P)-dependent dehydrogenase (short-subunit alcohol dehydrogenase family)
MDIKDSVALVTGANRGVGAVYVEALLARGARKVYAAARDVAALDRTVARDPGRVVPLKLDVTNVEDVAAAAAAARDVTLLVNNAGALSFGGPLEVGPEPIARDMAVNFGGLREMTRAFAPIIADNGGGAVVNMLTLLSFLSVPGFAAYNASKAAAWSMAMSLRPRLAGMGVATVNVFPAGIDTEMLAGVEAAKDAPADVVREALDAIEAGLQDVYPASAAGVHSAWRQDQKAVERMFATMG